MTKYPQHVAIIMDGNGRWANQKFLPRTQGHVEGVKRVEEIVAQARRYGIGYLTRYTFSTEDWNRPEDEVSILMGIFMNCLATKAKELHGYGVKICFIGRRQGIPNQVLNAMDDAVNLTKGNKALTLNVAFNYGSRLEILDAVKVIAMRCQQGKQEVKDITEEDISNALYTAGQPDPDLLIRTSGEVRLSNFLLWQLSYAELYFTDKTWPDFNAQEFDKALESYATRNRRFGGVNA